MNNVQYLLALHSINGLGPVRLKSLLDYFQDPKLAWEADKQELQKIGTPGNIVQKLIETRSHLNPNEYVESIKNSGINWLTLFDDDYPVLLKQIYDPPIVLFYKGNLKYEKAIAVVGTRKITGYGKAVTDQFVKKLVEGGLTIVSGLARGVDSYAHFTTLKEGGKTIAVLGSGLNQVYPPENKKLSEDIIKGGGALISEFVPDQTSFPGNFPARNRIISGLSAATLVIEAAVDSGSLITARLALEQGREVFAVPGPITSDLSMGPIDLIKEGAIPVTSAKDVLDVLGIKRSSSVRLNLQDLTEDEQKVMQCLQSESIHIDELGRILNFPSAKISALLLKMEISGLVTNLGSGIYSKV